jgi:hypothetical protein
MGWVNPDEEGVPALEQVEAGLRIGSLASWLIERADQGIEDQLLIARTVGGQNGIGVAETIHRLDPRAHADGYVWGTLWGDEQGQNNPYKDKGIVHDNAGKKGLKAMWDVAVLLGDTIDPATGQSAYTPGLVYTGKTMSGQQQAHKTEKNELAKRGIAIITATVGHMAVDSASLREQGQSQRAGVTRLIHYPERGSRVPSVCRDVGRLNFGDSHVDFDWNNNGARRLVRVPIAPLEA